MPEWLAGKERAMDASVLDKFLQTSVLWAWCSSLTVGKAWPGLEDVLSCRNPRLSPFLPVVHFFWSPDPDTMNSFISICCVIAVKGVAHRSFRSFFSHQDHSYHLALERKEAEGQSSLPQAEASLSRPLLCLTSRITSRPCD